MPIWVPSRREELGHLLDRASPLDAAASHYLFEYPSERVRLLACGPEGSVRGFLARVRTSFDLSQPELLTLRACDEATALALLRAGAPPGKPVYLALPANAFEVARGLLAFLDVEPYHVLVCRHDRKRVSAPPPGMRLVATQELNGTPLFQLWADDVLAAFAGANWISDRFGELRVHTAPGYRGRGLAAIVLGTACRFLLDGGRVPLYCAAGSNTASLRLAAGLGFEDTGGRELTGLAVLPLKVPAAVARAFGRW
jgi:GNAT superfamily N-acetyltransferase